MILRETPSLRHILFEPETTKEWKFLDNFPGLLREGTSFFSTNNSLIIQNLYARIKKQRKDIIKFTPYIKSVLTNKEPLLPLPSSFSYFTSPLPHQDLALRFAYTHDNIGLLLEPGLGKTKIVLDFIYLKGFKKSLVICPKPLLGVWAEETIKHRPELKTYIISSTNWEEEKDRVQESNVIVINYDKAIILQEKLSEFSFDFIGLDEGLIKNYKTERTKVITKLSRKVPYRMIMSGTLVNNSPMDLFAPIRFIEPSLIGLGVTHFKNRYVVPTEYKGKPIFRKEDREEIKTILEACSIVMRKSEWLKDLPNKLFTVVPVKLSQLQEDWYSYLASNWILNKEFTRLEFDIEISLVLVLLGKLNQISNGFLYYRDSIEEEEVFVEYGEVKTKSKKVLIGPRFVYQFPEQPKIEKLLEIIEDSTMLKGRRAIIWFNLRAELDLLEWAFKKEKISYSVIAGGEKNITGKVNEFNSNPTIRFCLCQAKTINYGVTLIGEEENEEVPYEFSSTISDEIFYSLNYSLEVYLQQQDRIHRIGQKRDCKYWILQGNTSTEKEIFEALQDKLELNREMLQDISKRAKIL